MKRQSTGSPSSETEKGSCVRQTDRSTQTEENVGHLSCYADTNKDDTQTDYTTQRGQGDIQSVYSTDIKQDVSKSDCATRAQQGLSQIDYTETEHDTNQNDSIQREQSRNLTETKHAASQADVSTRTELDTSQNYFTETEHGASHYSSHTQQDSFSTDLSQTDCSAHTIQDASRSPTQTDQGRNLINVTRTEYVVSQTETRESEQSTSEIGIEHDATQSDCSATTEQCRNQTAFIETEHGASQSQHCAQTEQATLGTDSTDTEQDGSKTDRSLHKFGSIQIEQSGTRTDCSAHTKQVASQSDCSTQTSQGTNLLESTDAGHGANKTDISPQTEQGASQSCSTLKDNSGIHTDSSAQTKQDATKSNCPTQLPQDASQIDHNETEQDATKIDCPIHQIDSTQTEHGGIQAVCFDNTKQGDSQSGYPTQTPQDSSQIEYTEREHATCQFGSKQRQQNTSLSNSSEPGQRATQSNFSTHSRQGTSQVVFTEIKQGDPKTDFSTQKKQDATTRNSSQTEQGAAKTVITKDDQADCSVHTNQGARQSDYSSQSWQGTRQTDCSKRNEEAPKTDFSTQIQQGFSSVYSTETEQGAIKSGITQNDQDDIQTVYPAHAIRDEGQSECSNQTDQGMCQSDSPGTENGGSQSQYSYHTKQDGVKSDSAETDFLASQSYCTNMTRRDMSLLGFTETEQGAKETDCFPPTNTKGRRIACTQTEQKRSQIACSTQTEHGVRTFDRFTNIDQGDFQIACSTQTEHGASQTCSTQTEHGALKIDCFTHIDQGEFQADSSAQTEQSGTQNGFTQTEGDEGENACSAETEQNVIEKDCCTHTDEEVSFTEARGESRIDCFTQTIQDTKKTDSAHTEKGYSATDCSTQTEQDASQKGFAKAKQSACPTDGSIYRKDHSSQTNSGEREQGKTCKTADRYTTTEQFEGFIQTGHMSHMNKSSNFARLGSIQKKIKGLTRSHSKRYKVSQGTHGTNGSQTQLTKPSVIREEVDEATQFWRKCVCAWYPKLHNQTYFLPPLYFNKVPYDIQILAGQTVLVPETPGHVPVNIVPSGTSSLPKPPPLASQLWPDESVPPGDPIPRVQDSDVHDDRATLRVLHAIRELADQRDEPMMVLSHLDFRKYLDKQDAITAAVTHLLLRPATLGLSYGSFNLLIISNRYGLIVGEIKSVGADPQYRTSQAVVMRVEKAVRQLNKADVVLRQLVSDLAPVKVTKILMLPNLTSTQLQQALDTDPHVEQDLCKCVGAPDTTAAVARCLCADTIQNKSSVWWERAVTDHGRDKNMTDDIYETLVARFCGPATTVEVPTVTTPQRAVELRTFGDAIAHTGLRMAVLTLYPEQVKLLNNPELPRVFLWGPPGTGKSVVLTVKGLQWGKRRKSVHLLSSHKDSRAITILIEQQLLYALKRDFAATLAAAPHVHRHTFNFNNKEEIEIAVNTLAEAATNDELYVIADEVFCDGHGRFAEFVSKLADRVPGVHLWAAAVQYDVIPPSMLEQRLTTPVRCPPAIVKEVQESEYFQDGCVPSYTSSLIPAPTDGPELMTLRHYTQSGVLLPLHSCRQARNCGYCANNIYDLLVELCVGRSDKDLQYRDTIILCERPHDDLPVVSRLLAHGLPVKVVTSRDDEATIHDLALAVHDAVIVADRDVVAGLERRVVVVIGNMTKDSDERLYALSRSTSLLVRVI